jgi:hypothetical protein
MLLDLSLLEKLRIGQNLFIIVVFLKGIYQIYGHVWCF